MTPLPLALAASIGVRSAEIDPKEPGEAGEGY
jgi:hypothetical protein